MPTTSCTSAVSGVSATSSSTSGDTVGADESSSLAAVGASSASASGASTSGAFTSGAFPRISGSFAGTHLSIHSSAPGSSSLSARVTATYARFNSTALGIIQSVSSFSSEPFGLRGPKKSFPMRTLGHSRPLAWCTVVITTSTFSTCGASDGVIAFCSFSSPAFLCASVLAGISHCFSLALYLAGPPLAVLICSFTSNVFPLRTIRSSSIENWTSLPASPSTPGDKSLGKSGREPVSTSFLSPAPLTTLTRLAMFLSSPRPSSSTSLARILVLRLRSLSVSLATSSRTSFHVS